MSNLIYGIDVSNNNGTVNFAKVKVTGKQYVYIKATEGTTLQDSYMKSNNTNARAVGLKVGAFHFLVSTSTPETQAKNFYNTIKQCEWDLRPSLDIEINFSGLDEYIQRFVSAFAQYTDEKLVLYSYTGFLPYIKNCLSMFDSIWIANYNFKADLISVANDLVKSAGCKIVGHQYYGDTGTCSGVNGACDLDIFTEDVLASKNKTISGKWIPVGSQWWYKHDDGTYTKSAWEYIDGKWYHFNEDGWMEYSWVRDGGYWYFLGEVQDGSMKTGWAYDKEYDRWFYMNDKGEMQLGWQKVDDEWYYLQPKSATETDSKGKTISYTAGEMRTGWVKDNNKWYCLYSSGKMLHDTVAYGYKFDSNGVATKL